MTKQEAIEILRDTPIDIRCTREDDIHTLYATAQGMAIEALSCSEKPNRSDTIYRQDAIDALSIYGDKLTLDNVAERIYGLPSAQPEIIRCRNCKFASGDSRICMKFGHSPIGELDFCAWAERRTDEE